MGADAEASTWQKFVSPDGPRDVVAGEDPGITLLSRREIAKLQEVARRFERDDDYAVAMYAQQFSEWKKNEPKPGSSRRIPLDDFLEGTGTLNKKAALLDREEAEQAAERAFGAPGTLPRALKSRPGRGRAKNPRSAAPAWSSSSCSIDSSAKAL